MADSWRIVSSDLFRDKPCNRRDQSPVVAAGILSRLTSQRRAAPRCPPAGSTSRDLEAEVIDIVDTELAHLGYEYRSTGGPAPILWCLGGPEVLQRLDDEHEYDSSSCIDLTVYLCNRHRVIEVDLWPHSMSDHQLAPDWPTAILEFQRLLGEFFRAELNRAERPVPDDG